MDSRDRLHIGIILDGNRRWANENGKRESEGHRTGYQNLKNLFKWAEELGIGELSLYCFSIQNFSRENKEVSYLMRLFESGLKEILESREVRDKKARIRFIGRLNMLPEKIQEYAEKAMKETAENENYTVNFCIAYGGREEIVDAANKAIDAAKEGRIDSVDEKSFSELLYMNSEPDIVIRTSGEKRTSNFLMWQSNYSEWFFIDKYWPDFSMKDLESALKEFRETRKRRFGK